MSDPRPVKPYYEQDGITIYHGDCRELLRLPEVYEVGSGRDIDGGGALWRLRADLVLTDPPYGIFLKGGKWGKKFGGGLDWDRKPVDNLWQIIQAGRDQIVWGGNYYSLPPSRGWLVWYKRDAVPSAADVELAWTSYDMNARLIDQTIAATNAERVAHPTQKPLEVMQWCLGLAPEARTILDPFCGSGTALVAAHNMGRSAIGIEIEERYCEIAARRLDQGVLELGA